MSVSRKRGKPYQLKFGNKTHQFLVRKREQKASCFGYFFKMTGHQLPAFELRKLTGHVRDRKSEVDLHFSLLSLTSYLLVVTAAVLLSINTVGGPIECLCPPHQTPAQCNYTKSWCRISPVLFIDYDTEIPHELAKKEKVSRQKMDGYSVVPLVLILLAFCLRLPSFLWRECSDSLNKALSLRSGVGDNMADLIINRRSLRTQKENSSRRLLPCLKLVSACGLFVLGKRLGTYQTGLFLFTKLLSVCILAGAFVLLAGFMQTDVAWGWNLVHARLTGSTGLQAELSFFPREVLCDVRVRQMTSVLTYTVQCVLPINMWSEKVFVALWFWLLFLLLLSIVSYLFWFRSLLFSSGRRSFVRKLYPEGSFGSKASDRVIRCAEDNFLDCDTLLLLFLLESSYGLKAAQEVAAKLRGKLNTRKTQ